MKNLEQIRAAAAIGPAKSMDKSAINKLPAMILSNGLLATAAFCKSESEGKNRTDMAKALDETARHLSNRGILKPGVFTAEAMIEDLTARDSSELQRASSEALAFIGYLRRFASKPEKDGKD